MGTPGEDLFNMASNNLIPVEHPVKVIVGSTWGIIRNVKGVFQNKKMLISALVLGGIWLLLAILSAVGVEFAPLKWLSIATFAHGGLSTNPVEIVGGLVGKSVYGAVVLSMLSGGFGGVGIGIKKVFTNLKALDPKRLSLFLIGLGVALVSYNFMAGAPEIIDFTVAIAALLMVLRSIGNYNGFLRRLVASLTASKNKKMRSENVSHVNLILSGAAVGFVLAIPMSLIPLGWVGYLIGGVAFVAGGALYFSKPEAAAALLALCLVLQGIIPAFAITITVDDTEHLPYDQPNAYHYDYDDGYWDSATNSKKYYDFEEVVGVSEAPYNVTESSYSRDFEFMVRINDYDERQYKPLTYDQIYVTLHNIPADVPIEYNDLFFADQINYGKPFQELWTTPDPPSDVTSSRNFMARQGDAFNVKVTTFRKPDAIYNKAIPSRPLDTDIWTYFVSLFSTSNYVEDIKTHYKLEGAEMSNTTLFGYPALVFTVDDKRSTDMGQDGSLSITNHYTYRKVVFLYIDDVLLPVDNDVERDENNKVEAVNDRAIIVELDMESMYSAAYSYSKDVRNTVGFAAVYAEHQAKEQALLAEYRNRLDEYLETADQIAVDVRHVVKVADQSAMIGVDTDASEASGEEGEMAVSVPEAIVIGALSVVAALGAAGGVAASSSAVSASAGAAAAAAAGKNADELTKRSTYQMRIRKDFGNKIKIGASPVTVYAKMVEITESGQVVERPDMTSGISIRSGASPIVVEGNKQVEQYAGALVSAERVKDRDTTSEQTGVVVFAYTGESGVFENRVKFHLVGDPYIAFDNMPTTSGVMICEMIRGDGLEYNVTFEVKDFMNPPEVSVENSHADVICECVELSENRYKIQISNRTAKADKLDAEKIQLKIFVKAENEKELATSECVLIAYPEGLSVEGPIEDGHLIVRSYLNEAAGDLDAKIKPTNFHLKLAVVEQAEGESPRALLVPMSAVSIEFAELRSDDSHTATILEKYEFEWLLDHAKSGLFTIAPKSCLPELTSPYYAVLPVTGTYKGVSYALELPIRLKGEQESPMKAREEELKKLLERIRNYMPPDEWSSVLGKIKQQQDSLSVTEMRLMSKSIISTAQARWLDEYKAEMSWSDQLDWIIYGLEWAKWFGDQAFAYVATVYTGPVGEAILSPAKEIFTSMIGEVGVQIVYGETFDFEKLQIMNHLSTALDNLVMTAADPQTLNVRQLASVLAGFLIINMAKNYVVNVDKNGNRDFYKTMTDAFSNLTSNAMKILASDLFGKAMRSPQARNAMNTQCGKWVRENLQKYLPDMESHFDNAFANGIVSVEKLAIVEKYITEFVGMGASTVYTKLSEHKLTSSPDDVIFTISIWKDVHGEEVFVDLSLKAIGEKLYDFMFESIFAIFPFASTAVKFNEDPPFYSEA